MVDVIEATFNIRVQHIFVLFADITKDGGNRIMGTASWSEPIAVGFKHGFPLGFDRACQAVAKLALSNITGMPSGLCSAFPGLGIQTRLSGCGLLSALRFG